MVHESGTLAASDSSQGRGTNDPEIVGNRKEFKVPIFLAFGGLLLKCEINYPNLLLNFQVSTFAKMLSGIFLINCSLKNPPSKENYCIVPFPRVQ